MANLAAKRPDYAGPDVATRWKPGTVVKGRGAPATAWIKQRLYRRNSIDEKTDAEEILEHQIAVAKSWDVRTVGRDSDGEPIKVASGRDSTEAAKLLFGIIGLIKKPGDPLAMAEHFRQVERDRIELSLKLLGDRVNQWEPARIKEFFDDCARDPRGFLLAAESFLNAQDATEPQLPPPPESETSLPNSTGQADTDDNGGGANSEGDK